jgi:hypothetical protein
MQQGASGCRTANGDRHRESPLWNQDGTRAQVEKDVRLFQASARAF